MKMKEKPCKALHSLKPTMKGVGMTKTVEKHVVEIWEYDRWSGCKFDHCEYFDSKLLAMQFVKQYNAVNATGRAPEFYVQAEYIGVKTFPVFN